MAESPNTEIMGELTPKDVFTDKTKLKTILATIDKEAEKLASDMSMRKNRDAVTKLAATVTRTRTAIEAEGRDQKEEAQAHIKKVNELVKELKETLDDKRDAVRKPLDDWNEQQEKLEEDRKEFIAQLEAMKPYQGENAEKLQKRLDDLKGIELPEFIMDGDEWEEKARQLMERQRILLDAAVISAKEAERKEEELEQLRREKAENERKEKERQEQEAEKRRLEQEEHDKRMRELKEAEERAAAREKAAAEAQEKLEQQAKVIETSATSDPTPAAETPGTGDPEPTPQRGADNFATEAAIEEAEKEAAAPEQEITLEATEEPAEAAEDLEARKEKTRVGIYKALKALFPGATQQMLIELIRATEAGKIPHLKIDFTTKGE